MMAGCAGGSGDCDAWDSDGKFDASLCGTTTTTVQCDRFKGDALCTTTTTTSTSTTLGHDSGCGHNHDQGEPCHPH